MDFFINHLLKVLDDGPVHPTREQTYLSLILMKNLRSLCTLGTEILSQSPYTEELPDIETMQLLESMLLYFYHDDFFIPHEELGSLPNWGKIKGFSKDRLDNCFRIYCCIKENCLSDPQIIPAIQKRDKKYFLDNFQTLFAKVPFQNQLYKFRNFVASDAVSEEDQECVWEFFESITNLFESEADLLEQLKTF